MLRTIGAKVYNSCHFGWLDRYAYDAFACLSHKLMLLTVVIA